MVENAIAADIVQAESLATGMTFVNLNLDGEIITGSLPSTTPPISITSERQGQANIVTTSE